MVYRMTCVHSYGPGAVEVWRGVRRVHYRMNKLLRRRLPAVTPTPQSRLARIWLELTLTTSSLTAQTPKVRIACATCCMHLLGCIRPLGNLHGCAI